jgi:hypothetical protein
MNEKPTIGAPADPIVDEKLEHAWQAQRTEILEDTDGKANKIDKPIVETVTALNLLGVETINSCIGHNDFIPGVGNVAPYIGVGKNPENVARAQALVDDYNQQSTTEDHAQLAIVSTAYKMDGVIWNEDGRQIASKGHKDIPRSPFMILFMITKKGRETIKKRDDLGRQYTQEMLAFGDFLKLKYYREQLKNKE